MSLRFFEGQDHAKVYAQFRPVPPESLIKRIVEFVQEKYKGPLSQAVDLGCGSGQCTFTLQSHFSSVLGTDISAAQVAEARESCRKLNYGNVKFETSPAEKIPVEDNAAQLITVCTALHWMNIPKVFEEARRALAKNGVFAIMASHLPDYLPLPEDSAKTDAIKKLVEEAVNQTLVYWPKEAFMCFEEYDNLDIPFSDVTKERYFPFERKATLADIVGCIRSYSPFQSLCKDKGIDAGEKLLNDIATGITSILNEGRKTPLSPKEIEEYEFTSTNRYFVVMSRI